VLRDSFVCSQHDEVFLTVKAKKKQIDDLKADITKRDAANAELTARLERLERQLSSKP